MIWRNTDQPNTAGDPSRVSCTLRGMKQTRLAKRAGAIAAALALALPAAAPAGTATSVVQVSAAVRPSAIIRFQTKTSGIAVTSQDIAAGYVYVPASSLLSLKTAGVGPLVTVEFLPLEGVFRSVEVVTTDTDDFAGGGPSAPPQRPAAATPGKQTVTAFSYRFNLAANAVPGVYATPMIVSVDL
ncbi:MAG TPA: hypothetical protein VE935_05850 [Burkholderiales bacterium]|nr:hypothetical protein [Burkholderiales bacterium]